MPAAPPAHHVPCLLARLEPATRAAGRQVPRPGRRRQPGHGGHPAQQCAGGKPQLTAAHLLHAAPAPRWFLPGAVALLSEPPPLPAQPPCRAPGQKSARAADRPSASALAEPARLGTASAPASLIRGGWPPPARDTLPAEIRPS